MGNRKLRIGGGSITGLATALMLVALPAVFGAAQSPATAPVSGSDDTVAIDDLMWATTTNGRDSNWMDASTYCRELTLAGHTGWRLPTLYELEALYLPDSDSTYRIQSPIELDTCCVWSTTNLEQLGEPEDLETIRHEPWLNAWGLMFTEGIRYYSYMLQPDGRALCVRENE